MVGDKATEIIKSHTTKSLISDGKKKKNIRFYVKYNGKPLGDFKFMGKINLIDVFKRSSHLHCEQGQGARKQPLQWPKQKLLLAWTGVTDGEKWLDGMCFANRVGRTTYNIKY